MSHLIDNLVILPMHGSNEKVVGMRLRTFQRRRGLPVKPFSKERSGRIWKFAKILAKATEVLRSREEEDQWLDRPAIGLDRRRPIDLLETPAGMVPVADFLRRLKYGVYV